MKKVYIGIDTHKDSNTVALAFAGKEAPELYGTGDPLGNQTSPSKTGVVQVGATRWFCGFYDAHFMDGFL